MSETQHWYIRYTWVQLGTGKVVRLQKQGTGPKSGEGWGCIDIHPFKWIKAMRDEKGIGITIHFYAPCTEEEQAMFADLFTELPQGQKDAVIPDEEKEPN